MKGLGLGMKKQFKTPKVFHFIRQVDKLSGPRAAGVIRLEADFFASFLFGFQRAATVLRPLPGVVHQHGGPGGHTGAEEERGEATWTKNPEWPRAILAETS